MPALELACIGPPTARVGGAEPSSDILWRKHLALLIYLALSPEHTRSRDHLIGLLWPEKPLDKARHSLNEAIRRFRAALGDRRVATKGDRITLNPVALEVDVQHFDELRARDPIAAVGLLRGEFLEGFHVDDAPAFEEWAAAERTRLRETALALLVETAQAELATGHHAKARELISRALVAHPHSESAAALAILAAALDGDVGSALSVFHKFSCRLKDDLGENPTAQVVELAERVRTEEWKRYSGRYRELEPPFVGRSALHKEMFATVHEALRRGPQCLVIYGDPGTGKSRMLCACAERFALGGATTSVVRLLETDHDARWSTLRALIRAGLVDAPGMPATDPTALAVLASVAPEFATRVEPIAARDVGQVSDALGSLLSAIAEETPVALAIDEAHLADGASIAALCSVWQRTTNVPMTLLITTSRPGPETPDQLATLLGRVGRDIEGTSVRLEAFTAEEMKDLVIAGAPWCSSDDEQDRLARRLALESGGNPFLAVMLLRDLTKASRLKKELVTWPPPGSTYDAPLPFTIPSMVRVAIVARVAYLDADAAAALRAASICGVALDIELIQHLTGLTCERIDAAGDQLERHGFVVFTGERYLFKGQLLPSVIRAECVRRGEQHRLREKAVMFLESREDVESQALRVDLLAADSKREAAFDAAVHVIEAALVAGAERTVRRTLVTAEAAAASDEVTKRSVIESFKRRMAG